MSSDSLSRRALELLDQMLDVPEAERDEWIARECMGSPELATEVRALRAASERAEGFLEHAPGFSPVPDLSEALQAALLDDYVIVREIGRGGMATVFLARERKHDRDVVIKVLEPSIAHIFGAERFLREIRIAATLAHPHIVPLIDSGEVGGFLHYVMPWMEGETLRERIRRGRTSITEGIGILRDVAGALEFAHAAGVVHRDLKPENVLLTAGHAYLLDFGIAKLLHDSSAAMNITVPGFAVGTRQYMAPEQAFAAEDVDHRADIYAWGVLGVELLTAEAFPPGPAEDVAPGMLAKRDDLPRPLIALLLECVATLRERRPATMAKVVSRLDALARLSRSTPATVRRRSRIGGGIALLAVAVAASAWLRDRDKPAPGTGLEEPIAMTILRNETGDSSLSVVGRFAGDWVTDGLQRMGGVRVIPWSEALLASEHAASTGAPLAATMRDETRAATVLTGSIYLVHDSLQFQARLSDARTGAVVSSLAPIVVSAKHPEVGIAQLRDRVMGAVASARDERVAALPGVTRNPPSFPAYQAFDHGLDRFLAQRYAEALEGFRTALQRDPTFTAAVLLGARAAWNNGEYAVAESLVTQARVHGLDHGTYNESSLRYLEAVLQGDGARARAAIQRAAEIAPNSRAGFDYASSLLDAGYARQAHEQLQRMNPDRGEMRGWSSYWTQLAHATHLLGDGAGQLRAAREMKRRHPERRVALVLEARALALSGNIRALDSALVSWDSLPSNVYWSQGAAMTIAAEELIRQGRDAEGRQYGERAVAWLANRLVATPNDRGHREWMGTVLYALGRYADARPYFESLAKDYPARGLYRGMSALIAKRRGDHSAADRWLAGWAPRDTGENLAYRARLFAIAGETERAVALLTSAVDRGVDGYPWMHGSGFRDFALLSKDPRARGLLAGR